MNQESLFYWFKRENQKSIQKYELSFGTPTGSYINRTNYPKAENWLDGFIYSAFTVAELGEMLQKYSPKFDLITHMMQMDIANTEQRYAVHIPNVNEWTAFTSATEADARGKMLIYLIENKLIEVENG